MYAYTHTYISWSNYATDMLECSHCQAKLCITFNPQLTPTQKEQVTLQYQRQLSTTGHANKMCLFWDDDSKQHDDGSAVPLFLARVLDPDFVELLEHATPHTVLLDRANRFASCSQKQIRDIINPLQQQQRQDRLLMNRVKQKVRSGYTATILALLGWSYPEKEEEDDDDKCITEMTLMCKVCDSEFHGNIVTSHKYYCPWRCGFPPDGEPCWKVVANKIVAQSGEEDDDKFANDALSRLQAVLIP